MSGSDQNPLGRAVAAPVQYDPSILFAIPRSAGRAALSLGPELPFAGYDRWLAWEVSWLNAAGMPQVAVAEFNVPANSPNIIESKSLKLYLQSLNQSRVGDASPVQTRIEQDLSAIAGAAVEVVIYAPDDWAKLQRATSLPGRCIDTTPVALDIPVSPDAGLLATDSKARVSAEIYSRLFRSLCPVTGQPDWATICIQYAGPNIDEAGLLAYLLGFRTHAAYHEQCVEQIFCDIQRQCAPDSLDVRAAFLRRGGLDINPRRYSGPASGCDMLDLRQ